MLVQPLKGGVVLTALCVLILLISRLSLLERNFSHTEHATHCQSSEKWSSLALVLHASKTVNDSTVFSCQDASVLEPHLENIETWTVLLALYKVCIFLNCGIAALPSACSLQQTGQCWAERLIFCFAFQGEWLTKLLACLRVT